MPLRVLSLAHRVVHRLSGGRIGSLHPGAQAPRGRTLQIITKVHRRLYLWTGGIVGANAGGLPTLLLTTRGRKTGSARTVPLPYFAHPEGYVVVASFAGGPKNPAWYGNLVTEPNVEVQIRTRRFAALASAADRNQRATIWPRIVAAAPMYADYQQQAPREIPVVVLRPQ
jgi:deazaflavin-dependent oxidoreductase (nitroreductase family)